jgi:hypothetical protein
MSSPSRCISIIKKISAFYVLSIRLNISPHSLSYPKTILTYNPKHKYHLYKVKRKRKLYRSSFKNASIYSSTRTNRNRFMSK